MIERLEALLAENETADKGATRAPPIAFGSADSGEQVNGAGGEGGGGGEDAADAQEPLGDGLADGAGVADGNGASGDVPSDSALRTGYVVPDSANKC